MLCSEISQKPLKQVHLRAAACGYEPVSSSRHDLSVYVQEQEALQASLVRLCPDDIWPSGANETCSARPVLVTQQHQQQIAQLHTALTLGITDIVERWWSDEEAQFPKRMPLAKQEEDLLQWLETWRSPDDTPYRDRAGSWRPDFLVEDDFADPSGQALENFRITEINARFSFNGYMLCAYGQDGLADLGMGRNGVFPATDSAELINGLLGLFRHDRPLHLLKGSEPGYDIHMFIDFLKRKTGISPRLVTPADLRLIPDDRQRAGYKLCCLVKDQLTSPAALITHGGESMEEIHQLGLELHQHELLALEPEMLRQVSLRCFNDMRTVLLVHDKRMLGILKQEIPQLVSRGVLSAPQGLALEKGIADTILPGSPELEGLIKQCTVSPNLRHEYILKPIRSGKGAGIIFGDDMDDADWVAALGKLCRASRPVPVGSTYVVQRRIRPRLYELVLRASGERVSYPLIGTFHAVHGKFLGLGVWRSSPDRIVAISHGGSWMCSVVHGN
ncbi:hypothetical protein BDW71DRAFT_202441 [Aspergillus fruticulosus]